jgi:hypothetical protein
MVLPDVLIAVTACEHHGDYSRPCGAVYVKRHGDDAGVVRRSTLMSCSITVTLRGYGGASWLRSAISRVPTRRRMSGSIGPLLLGGTALATILPTHETKLALTLGVISAAK